MKNHNLLLDQFSLEELEERLEFRDWDDVYHCGVFSDREWEKHTVEMTLSDGTVVTVVVGKCE